MDIRQTINDYHETAKQI